MNYPLSALLAKFDRSLDNDPNQLRILLIGSAASFAARSVRIVQTTHQLHHLGFADVSDWTPLLPLPNSDDLFSLLTRSKR